MAGRMIEDITQTVHGLIREFAPVPTEAGLTDQQLIRDLGYHSLALLELAFALEDEFQLPPMDEEQAQRISSADQVVDYVVSQLVDSVP